MTDIRVLWIDDEIDLLKPHVMFLQAKGYEVFTLNNGVDAVETLQKQPADIVFLDEQMPGLSGMETLSKIKEAFPTLPVVMVTKSEEERIMDEAIGSKISDYLLKPVNPGQILLSIKKLLESKRLENEKSTSAYQQEFREISASLSPHLSYKEWENIYRKLVFWEMELSASDDGSIRETLQSQRDEANLLFGKFVEQNYRDFLKKGSDNDFEMSHFLLQKKLFPLLDAETPVFFILIDNLRYDHWRVLQQKMQPYLKTLSEETYMAILPSVTQYARNSLFAGLMPSEIARKYPQYWVGEDSNEYKNQFEKELLEEYLKRHGKNIPFNYYKVLNQSYGTKILDYLPKMLKTPLNVIIYNFVDMFSHASTEVELLREMAYDDAAYRSLVGSWFEHSPLLDLIRNLAGEKVTVVITTDHGSIRIADPVRIKGDRETSSNLRYKSGRILDYNAKDVFEVRNPEDIFLPKTNLSSSFVFCKQNDFFVYPNNYNQYVAYYKNTVQHGGISMEEMMVPYAVLQPK
ncbi:MAG: PglZ domain-containing protein [Bacteroidales bacterium]|nr:PglZ domain-containing protein [Bacteroidales bacterium]MDE5608850.1 PglZ domain-containing protein [Bacteroidales bacterium]